MGLGHLLFEQSRVQLSGEGVSALRKLYPDEEQFKSAAYLIQHFVDSKKYKPPSVFDGYHEYISSARGSVLSKGKTKGVKLEPKLKRALYGLFDKIHDAFSKPDDFPDFSDPITAGREFDFGNAKVNKVFKSFISSLDEISTGKPQSGFIDLWKFLGGLSHRGQSSGIGEGISMLWTLVRKYGRLKSKTPDEATAGQLVGNVTPDQAKQVVDMSDETITSGAAIAVLGAGYEGKKLSVAEKEVVADAASKAKAKIGNSPKVASKFATSDKPTQLQIVVRVVSQDPTVKSSEGATQ